MGGAAFWSAREFRTRPRLSRCRWPAGTLSGGEILRAARLPRQATCPDDRYPPATSLSHRRNPDRRDPPATSATGACLLVRAAAIASEPASFGCRWSPESYAATIRSGCAGSRSTWSKSTTASNAPDVRIQPLTATRTASRSGVQLDQPWNGPIVAPITGRPASWAGWMICGYLWVSCSVTAQLVLGSLWGSKTLSSSVWAGLLRGSFVFVDEPAEGGPAFDPFLGQVDDGAIGAWRLQLQAEPPGGAAVEPADTPPTCTPPTWGVASGRLRHRNSGWLASTKASCPTPQPYLAE